MSKMFRLSHNDVVRSAATAIFVAALTVVYGVTQQPDFDIFSADWRGIGMLVANTSFTAFIARLAEKFLSTKDGKILGVIGH